MTINLKNLSIFQVVMLSFILSVLMPLATSNALEGEPAPLTKELAEENLEPFAGAYKEVTQIHNAYEQKIIESSEQSQVDVLQQEANDKMSKAVTNRGLTIEDYNKIFKIILNDPALKEEFKTVLNRMP